MIQNVQCYDCGQTVGLVWEFGGWWYATAENGRPIDRYSDESQAASEVRVAHGRRNGHGRCAR